MWIIEEVKARGKAAMKANYWNSVLAGFLVSLAVSGTGIWNAARSFQGSSDEMYTNAVTDEQAMQIMAAMAGAALVFTVVSSIISILVLNPLLVGCRHFFRRNLPSPAPTDEIGWGFKNRYGRNVLTMFLSSLFLVLWSLLFIIPGLVKCYSYRLVPYILEDYPDASPTEVITMSREMMNGNKMRAFELDLSFIGWTLLTVVTLGIAGVFYVNPYYASTDAALYEAIRAEKYGRADQGQLF